MNLGQEDIEEFLGEIGVGTRPIDDPFFQESYRIYNVFQRTGVTVDDDEELCHPVISEFPCNALGCRAVFHSLLDFEIHYNGSHRFTCLECRKIRPNARLLEIHIQETHDSFFKVLAEKQPMYQCYVTDCDIKFLNPHLRHEHCVKIHQFPKNYRYEEYSPKQKSKIKGKTKNPNDSMDIDQPDLDPKRKNDEKKQLRVNLNKNQKGKTFDAGLKNKKVSLPSEKNDKMHVEQKNVVIPKASSALVFIPRQLTQKSYSKILTKNTTKIEKPDLEFDNMMELADALPL